MLPIILIRVDATLILSFYLPAFLHDIVPAQVLEKNNMSPSNAHSIKSMKSITSSKYQNSLKIIFNLRYEKGIFVSPNILNSNISGAKQLGDPLPNKLIYLTVQAYNECKMDESFNNYK